MLHEKESSVIARNVATSIVWLLTNNTLDDSELKQTFLSDARNRKWTFGTLRECFCSNVSGKSTLWRGEGNTLDSKNLVASTHIKREKASLPVDVRRRGGGTPHMKGVGMLVVSLSGVNFGFWSRLGCSGQKAIIFSREGLV